MEWNDFKAMDTIKQVDYINQLLADNQMSVSDISKIHFNQVNTILSNYISRKGYKLIDNQYVKVEGERRATTSTKTKPNILEAYNNYLLQYDYTFKQTTVRINQDMVKRLDNFNKQYPVVKKQDLIGMAVDLFLRYYDVE